MTERERKAIKKEKNDIVKVERGVVENRDSIGKFTEGHTIWRIRDKHGANKRFPKPKDLEKAIDAYFDRCLKGFKTIIYDKRISQDVEITTQIPLTIEGLCTTLGITRNALLMYQKKKGYEEYHEIVVQAKMHVQRDTMERGLAGLNNPIVTIFVMKNCFGYTDKSEIEHQSKVIDVRRNLQPDEDGEEEEDIN